MSTAKSLILQVRYPYTAGVIMTIWLGTAALLAIEPSLNLRKLIIMNGMASVIIAILGFTTPRR